jgi:hypothetical protein
MATVTIRGMANEVGISHSALLRHIRNGVIRPDLPNGRFFDASIERVARELALNRANVSAPPLVSLLRSRRVLTVSVESKPNSRMIRTNTIGIMLMAS